MCSMTAPVS
ncbi:UNVERIFIED_CONTAM: hypothetical protein GTU68_023987 [Idotea baltica]|nr:hypothetical protein [Idotea baltica]